MIIQSHDVKKLIPVIDNLSVDMIFVDIDDTLIKYQHYTCRSSWFDNFIEQYGEERIHKIKNRTECAEKSDIVAVSEILNDWLMQKGSVIPLFALTNKRVAEHHYAESWRNELGISFTKIPGEELFEYNGTKIMKEGIIYCGYNTMTGGFQNSKGGIIEHFLKELEQGNFDSMSKPRSILFVDDVLYNLEMVQKACENVNVDFHGVHLTTVAHSDKNLSSDLETLQTIGMIQNYQIKGIALGSFNSIDHDKTILDYLESKQICPNIIAWYHE